MASSHAISGVRSACPSMSPARSMTATSPRFLTTVPAVPAVSLVVIVIASVVHAHHELEHVVVSVTGLLGLVDHVLDQEQAPAAWTLQPRELRLDVRHLCLVVLAGPAEVLDLHADPVGLGEHPHRDRLVGAGVGGVLHRAQWGLARRRR